MLGLDLGTTCGVCRAFLDGSIDAHHQKFESEMQARLLGVAGIVRRHAGPDCIGVCIEQPFGRNAKSLQVLYAMMGVASLAAVEAGLSVSLDNLVKLKMHATGKGTRRSRRCRKPHAIVGALIWEKKRPMRRGPEPTRSITIFSLNHLAKNFETKPTTSPP